MSKLRDSIKEELFVKESMPAVLYKDYKDSSDERGNKMEFGCKGQYGCCQDVGCCTHYGCCAK